MLAVTVVLGLILGTLLALPDLPLSQTVVRQSLDLCGRLRSKIGLGQAVVAISLALLLFAAIWTLQGDAPMVLAMVLPELAVWLTTFEIATLADALVGLGTIYVTARATGFGTYLKGRARARRVRRTDKKASPSANDDEPAPRLLAA